jgi:hypothetical protein
VPSNQSIQDAPIQLNQLAEHVRQLIDLVYSANGVPISTAQQYHVLLEMCDHLQMTAVKETIWKLARAQLTDPNAVGLTPWETFKLGTIIDMPGLCFDAASAFVRYNYTLDNVYRQPSEYYEDMPGLYVATLLNDHYYMIHGDYYRHAMSVIAGSFEKMHLEREK